MQVIRHISTHPRSFDGPVLTLGNFDGVHQGHRAILGRVVDEAHARSTESIALTFHPHPLAVLRPASAPPTITRLRDKIALIASLGIDVLVVQRFSLAFAQVTAEAFLEQYIAGRLRTSKVVVGHSVSFGHRRAGNAALLGAVGPRLGLDVEVVGPVAVGDHTVSSSRVRSAIEAGDVGLAAELLDRLHWVRGRVVRGEGRGATIGVPTANVDVRDMLLPGDGVYAVRMVTPYGEHPGVANVGRKPTFGPDTPRTLEAHLFDFTGDLYGARCAVSFVERLREERRFESVDALVAQIKKDAAHARRLLGC